MPFQSKAQERWAFATGQPFAKQWAQMTNQKALPARKGQSNRSNLDRLAESLARRKR